MAHGLRLEIIWIDSHMLELRVQVRSKLFSGESDFYVSHSWAQDAAVCLAGFPTGKGDERSLVFSDVDLIEADGISQATLRCLNSKGHSEAAISLVGSSRLSEFREMVISSFPIEASSIDLFVQELASMKNVVGSVAELHAAT